MKKIIILLFLVTWSWAAKAADGYRTLSVEILKPAKQPVVFTGRTPAIYAVHYVVSPEGEEPYRYKHDTLPVIEAALGVKAALEESEALASYDIPVYNYYIFCADSVCIDTVAPITDNDLLIIVKEVRTTPFQNFEKAYYYNTPYFQARTYAPYTVRFEILDAVTRQVSHRETMADTLVWSDAVGSISDADIPDLAEASRLMAAETGKQYAQTLQPYWKTVQRFLFVPDQQDMRRAADYAENGQWAEAMNIWNRYAAANNARIAAQAAFNIALGCEVGGNYALAKEWLQLAEKFYPVKEARGYQTLLQGRMNEEKLLEKQLQDLH